MSPEVLELLTWPFVACLVLVSIHTYLGLHVVERGVIFVDLSLAQVAALGATFAFLLGHDFHGRGAYILSLVFALAGAAVFSFLRMEKSRVPQEAIIGVVYAVSASAGILVMDKAPHGADHIKHILTGNLLAVTPAQIGKTALLYLGLGLLHWFFRKPLLAISADREGARRRGLKIAKWDMLFYGTFALVVTASVALAGVLLVFSFLVVPAVVGMIVSSKVGVRLAVGWGLSALVSIAGILGSYVFDTPTGATIVCAFGLALILVALVRRLVGRRLIAG